MTINRGLAVLAQAGVGTTPKEHRLALAGLLAENAPGVPRSGLLHQANTVVVRGTSSMTYEVLPNVPVINRATDEGVYTATFTGTTTAPTTAAPGSGSRWDLIWVKQNDTEKGDANNLAIVGVTQGAASGAPNKPYASVPAGALVLAEAEVGALISGTNSASITQVWRHTVTRGAAIPVRNQAERDEITAGVGTRVHRLDLKLESVWNGTRWVGGKGAVALAGGYVNFAGYKSAEWIETPEGLVTVTGIFGNSSANVTTVALTKYKAGAVPAEIAPAARIGPASCGADAVHWVQPLCYAEPNGDLNYSVNVSATSTANSFFVAFNFSWQATV